MQKPTPQFLQLVSQPGIQKRIISAKRYQSIFYSIRGKEIAAKHRFFKQGQEIQAAYVVYN